jgi:rubrerythrin
MSGSDQNLAAAFAGESQASRKYLFFAEKAEQDGQPQIARLFRAASEAETIHARNHLKAMKGINSVADNLKEAISGEYHEFTEMYPGFINQAEEEKNTQALTSFKWANQVEAIHHVLYQKALKDLESGRKLELTPIYVCPFCGNTVLGEAPERCPICGVSRDKFKSID